MTTPPQVVILKYDIGMKVAISLPDELFESADELAETLGMSRSELYANAVAEYFAKHRDQDITTRLNRVYGEQPSGFAPELRQAQGRSLTADEW